MLIATIRTDLDAVALKQAFEAVPEMKVEAERVAAHSTRWTMPCLWIAAADFDAVDDALVADPTVDNVVETHEFDNEVYYHLDWADGVEEQVDAYIDKEGSILNAQATANGWKLEIRFVSRDQFTAFREFMTEQGYTFELLDLIEPGTPRISVVDLTPPQRDALIAAADRGYYEVPREVTARELADDLDMTHQSLSELLRRGTKTLITSTLSTSGDDEVTSSGTDSAES
ncbi:helix-turn-helix domain-containing protein [Halobacteria archaeon AArc-curdl1]|uniref:Helix-turn-helix domain-containing protein n=1 Tax=Natronosalvus hydrolyticus TaxID=2979988 RepID=A0AAP2ZB14_9EURY|nr:helix-turn-helix domain-containing protein [Halobacteria archaeon AArc-curdl1]